MKWGWVSPPRLRPQKQNLVIPQNSRQIGFFQPWSQSLTQALVAHKTFTPRAPCGKKTSWASLSARVHTEQSLLLLQGNAISRLYCCLGALPQGHSAGVLACVRVCERARQGKQGIKVHRPSTF